MQPKTQIIRQPNGSIEIKLVIPWVKIQDGIKKHTETAVSKAEVPGFRKGKAPKEVVEPKLDKSSIISEVLGEILPETYSHAVTELDLKPFLYPQIRIDKGEDGKDWEFTAITCEAPVITLPDYVNGIKNIKITDTKNQLQPVIEYLHSNSVLKIPDLMIEEESNHRLADLAENLTHLGLDMNKYLTTKKMTAENLKAQTAQAAKVDLEIELIINQIRIDQKLPDRSKTLEYLQDLLPKIISV